MEGSAIAVLYGISSSTVFTNHTTFLDTSPSLTTVESIYKESFHIATYTCLMSHYSLGANKMEGALSRYTMVLAVLLYSQITQIF